MAAIRDSDFEKGDAILRSLGWVVEGEGHDALVAEYGRAIEERKANGERKSVLVIDPTHKDGDRLTEKLRALRREKGLVTGEEKTFARLVPLHLDRRRESRRPAVCRRRRSSSSSATPAASRRASG